MKMSSGKSSNSATNMLVFTAEYNNPQISPNIENPKVVKWNFCEKPCKFRIFFRKVSGTAAQHLKRMVV